MQKNYYAIIPANVRYDKDLPANAKLLYGEISALCNERGYCWAGNEYFAELYAVSKETISRWISQLVKKNYLQTKMIYKDGTKEIINRVLTILRIPIDEIINTPIDENVKDNITINNNTIEYKDVDTSFEPHIKEKKKEKKKVGRKKKEFIPPTTEEVCQYCRDNGYPTELGLKAFEYYNVAQWHDSKGNPVLNWKQKLQAIWFKPENKSTVKGPISNQQPKRNSLNV